MAVATTSRSRSACRPAGEIDFLVSVERSHLPTEVTGSNNSVGVTRGGTVKFVSGEIRVAFFEPDRTSPYMLAGAGRGVSRPNVNEIFPNPVRNDATLFFTGGGVRIPVSDHLSVFADVRFVIQIELDSAILLTPVRGGLAWRF